MLHYRWVSALAIESVGADPVQSPASEYRGWATDPKNGLTSVPGQSFYRDNYCRTPAQESDMREKIEKNQMSIQVSREQVYCENHRCQNPIVLPHQSLLGIFQGSENQPTDEWPATFLCPACGQVFVCSVDMIDSATPLPVPDSLIPDLLRVEYINVQENTETKKVIYTTCPRDADPTNELPRLRKSLSEIAAAVRVNLGTASY